MMKKIAYTISLLLLIAITGSAQPSTELQWKATGLLPGEYTDFTVDNLGNIYLLTASGQLKKLNAAGDSVAVFNDLKKYGRLFAIEVTNPLKILLYYKDFGTVLILDRLLNPRAVIDLRSRGLFQVMAIAHSYDNQIWIYDGLDAKLKKISEDGQVLSETADFRMLFNPAPTPEIIIDQDRKLHVYDRETGLYVFDYFGTLQNKLPFENWKSFTVSGNAVFGIKDSVLLKYVPGSLNLIQANLPEAGNTASKMVIKPWGFYLLVENGIARFEFDEKTN